MRPHVSCAFPEGAKEHVSVAPNTAAIDATADNTSSGAQALGQGVAVGTGPLASGAALAVGAAVAGPAPSGREAP